MNRRQLLAAGTAGTAGLASVAVPRFLGAAVLIADAPVVAQRTTGVSPGVMNADKPKY
jgi:hypothetical protein